MMLHVLLATALSASPALPTDSVRNASKTGTARRDTTVTAPRDTTITAKQAAPPPSPAAPAGSNVSSNTQAAAGPSSSTPAEAAPQSNTTTSGAWTTTLVKSSTVVVSTAPTNSTPPAPAPAAATTAPAPAPVVAARPEHTVVQQAAAAVPAPDKTAPAPALVAAGSSVVATSTAPRAEASAAPARAAAPADVSAVAPRPAEKSTRVDARTVVSIRSSERFEPLYSVPLPSSRIRVGAPTIADSIVIYKRERTLTLFYRGVPVKSYFVALGSNPVGDKQRAGDQRTPEGLFHINAHNPASKFHLALRISYPDDAHRARAAALGAEPGGDIMIHGLPPEYSEAGKDHVANDWTNGCVALSNAEIEELWRAVPDGTPVQIKP